MNRRESQADAKISQDASDGPGAGTADALCEAGFAHLQAGRPLDAQICCQRALARDAGHADALHLMGLLHLQEEQTDFAIAWIARAIQQGSPRPVYLLNLGVALHKRGRHEEALKAFDKAVQLKPDEPAPWRGLGEVLIALDRPDEAILSFQHALKLNPRYWDAANKCALLLYRSKRFEEALALFNLCDELQPNRALTLQMRALALRNLNRLDESMSDGRRAHELDPADPDTCTNIGDVLQTLGREPESLEWFDKALERKPDHSSALIRKALALTELRRFDEAFLIYQRLNRSGANTAMGAWNLALLQMLTGDFEAGWAGREARWAAYSPVYPKLPHPKWLGQGSIDGKTILVHVDEGLGDCIQFARYLPMMADRGARVILVVAAALVPLLSGLRGVIQCFSTGTSAAFDMHCPMSSLPLAFGTRLDSIPSATSYLPPPAESRRRTWEERLGSHDRLRVGLVWSGNPKHSNDRKRSLPLPMLSRILDLDACFVSLQKDLRDGDRAFLREHAGIVDLTEHLADFAETAALVSCLDLVITVDTSVAHLAGAMGCATWVLLPYIPDYRWLLDREDSPWYPTLRLFRQDESRDYGIVLDRVRSELLALISAK
jgi:tetratricopeptide (TPR) repeat protein